MLKELEDFANISRLKLTLRRHNLYGLAPKNETSLKTKWKLLWGKQAFKFLGINFNTDLTRIMEHTINPK